MGRWYEICEVLRENLFLFVLFVKWFDNWIVSVNFVGIEYLKKKI